MVRTLAAIVGVALLAVPVAALAKSPEPNVRGTLTKGPVSPVCVAERPCSAPAPGVVLVFSRGDQDVKRVTTGTAGRFATRLKPGTYGVRTLKRSLIGSRVTPARFKVPANGVVTLRLDLDTGIR
jgi:hypothetical protein